jgi:hypothetical protein
VLAIDLVFLDFINAFDTISIELLLEKQKNLGINDDFLILIKNMLLDRKQYVNYNNSKSYIFVINSGVVQEVVSSPLYFNIFVNDLSQNIDSSTPQFADDSVAINIIYNESIIHTLQKDLNKILNYMIENKLILNPLKSDHMRICFKNTKNLTQNYSINNKIINSSKS